MFEGGSSLSPKSTNQESNRSSGSSYQAGLKDGRENLGKMGSRAGCHF